MEAVRKGSVQDPVQATHLPFLVSSTPETQTLLECMVGESLLEVRHKLGGAFKDATARYLIHQVEGRE